MTTRARLLACAVLCALVASPAAHGAPVADPYGWAGPAAAQLVAAGALAPEEAADLSLPATRGQLTRGLALLTGRTVGDPLAADPVPARLAHRSVIAALPLAAERRGLAAIATADGTRFRLPAGFPAEILTRELGLRHNYLSADDGLERAGREPITRADLAGMVQRARELDPWDIERLAPYRTIVLPAMTPAQRTVVQAAIAQVGQPYIWGGDWPGRSSPWGAQAHGGFDCSGLVWMAFKGARPAAAMEVGRGLGGRTADDMAWERPAERVPAAGSAAAALAPGDLVFFGGDGERTRRREISHAGIALGHGWLIHSSGSRSGVAISALDSYWPSGIAWGRRVSELGPTF